MSMKIITASRWGSSWCPMDRLDDIPSYRGGWGEPRVEAFMEIIKTFTFVTKHVIPMEKTITLSTYEAKKNNSEESSEKESSERVRKNKKKKRRKQKKDQGWSDVPVSPTKSSSGNIRKPTRIVPISGKKSTTLVLKNLPFDSTSESDLKRFFQNSAPVKFLKVLRRSDGLCKGIGFLGFRDQNGADFAAKMNLFQYNGRPITIEYSR